MITQADIVKASILIVDDQEANVSLLDQILRGAGYDSITTTQNPTEVCELYREHRYDLILLDLQMPGMDGFEVMAALKEIEPGDYLPVLVITAKPEHKLAALAAGAKDFVTNPFEIAEVLMRVQNMLEVRLLNRSSRKLYDQLQAANVELQAFTYSVSHDLRAPLRHVLGFVEMLQKDASPSLSETSLELLGTITAATKRMGNLIDDLLAFSQVGHASLKKSPLDLDNLVQETLKELLVDTQGRNIAWTLHPLPRVSADRALLRMVLINLIANAVKFTGGRAEATIEIGCAPDEKGETVIYISDNGAGFNPKYTKKLFGVFKRLHSRDEFEGTGIGLANVQRIINRHGGRVWAEGTVNVGAKFYFSLPQGMATN
jgi:signal transduction histidine kinase